MMVLSFGSKTSKVPEKFSVVDGWVVVVVQQQYSKQSSSPKTLDIIANFELDFGFGLLSYVLTAMNIKEFGILLLRLQQCGLTTNEIRWKNWTPEEATSDAQQSGKNKIPPIS